MKAAYRHKYCTPSEITIKEVTRPVPKANEILIKTRATTINRTDCANLSAQPFIMRFVLGFYKPGIAILGTDVAGEVIEIGAGVTKYKIGDRVMSFVDTGLQSQAEYCPLHEPETYPIPKGIDYKVAAASLEGAHYAYSTIARTTISKGSKVLINGASGAIGSALLQFAHDKGAHITVTCRAKDSELMHSLGAERVIDYTQEDFTNSTETFDYILDAVGKSTFGRCEKILTPSGTYLSSELGPLAQNLFYPLLTKLSKRTVIFPVPYETNESIPFILKKLTEGTFRPVIEKEYSLDEISAAYTYAASGQKTGNLILSF